MKQYPVKDEFGLYREPDSKTLKDQFCDIFVDPTKARTAVVYNPPRMRFCPKCGYLKSYLSQTKQKCEAHVKHGLQIKITKAYVL